MPAFLPVIPNPVFLPVIPMPVFLPVIAIETLPIMRALPDGDADGL